MRHFSCLASTLLYLLLSATPIASASQSFTTVANFNGADGQYPYSVSLLQGTDGNFYGTTEAGGVNDEGVIFKLTPTGTITILHSFNTTDGANPQSGLIQGTDGSFYGTILNGGTQGYGTVFKLTSAGALTTLYSFCSASGCSDGIWPFASLIQGRDGNFYGTTTGGSSNSSCQNFGLNGCGTVFKINAAGSFTSMHTFNFSDGAGPYGGLVQGTDGNLYGTTKFGGSNSEGTAFKMTVAGKLTTLDNFSSGFGEPSNPYSGLLQGSDGAFYGTSSVGGSGFGMVFKITSAGKLTTLYSFSGSDGETPYSGLIQGTDGKFYGTTVSGGTTYNGTIFSITSSGVLATLHNFDGTDGEYPYANVIQRTNGSFYGLTEFGGPGYNGVSGSGDGSIFSLSTGLGAFVETNPASANVGSAVTILGINLTGATRVDFNGKAAKFKIVSSSEITTNVPVGATTGMVSVTTSNGVLQSNRKFQVLQ